LRKFVSRALDKFEKLDSNQVKNIIQLLAGENELLEMVLDSMTEGLVVLDNQFNTQFVNKTAERLGVKTRERERLIWDELRDPDIRDYLKEKAESQESVRHKEFSIQSGSSVSILELNLLPLVREGSIEGSLLILEDITERRNHEARLRRAESLASLTTLAAGVAHEIKNPLGSMGIHIQLMQRALNRGTAERDFYDEHLQIVNEEIERLNGIIVDFLFAVRPMDTSLRKQDLNTVVRDTLEFIEPECESLSIEVQAKLKMDLPDILIDEKFIKQALLNLIKNAMAAMPQGGRLTISTELKGESVVLILEDNGIGIDEENMSKIFEPYFTTKEFGSGLGLTVVYKIIKEHNGEISLNSKAGKGTSFYVSFPVPIRDKKLIGWQGEEE
jgi:two-component system, sporulation sensor kinase E